jgi:multiple sugar transport system substrate-binding protein
VATLSAVLSDVPGGAAGPDIFMSSRSDLSWLLENGYTQPVDELLDERGVEFGDTYSRDALQALSTNDHLQCMPYGVTPKVIYYNKRLVNFDRMRNRGLDAPDEEATSWSFDQFTAAAEFASRPARGSKGVHIAPTIDGLSPFILSGGGTVFDDADPPTSLAFSSDGSKDALERTLELLRNPQVTLDESQLDQATALRWFLRGKLGMIAGDRSLTPILRQKNNLDFDVMPMPKLDSAATVGDVTALCMSAQTASPAIAADFMVHEVSSDWVGLVASTGYLQPANVEVALADDFLQPGRRPEHATFFNSSVRSMVEPPLIDTMPELEETVAPSLQQMLYGVGVLDLDAITTQIDDESKPVLDPESASDAPSPSESPSE